MGCYGCNHLNFSKSHFEGQIIVPFGHHAVQPKMIFVHTLSDFDGGQHIQLTLGKPASKRRLRPLLGLSGYRNTCIWTVEIIQVFVLIY